MSTAPRRVVRFGTFEVDVEARELRKAGLEVRLQEQPRQVLLALLARPGETVTREELRHRLWPDGTFVDFEHGLNTAVKKLRDALGDAADNPRFIETVPLRGYRFTGPVEQPPRDDGGERRRWPIPWTWMVAAAAGVAIGSLWWVSRAPRPVRLSGSAQLTFSGRVFAPDSSTEAFLPLLTDGSRIYYTELSNSVPRVMQMPVTGGDGLPIAMPFEGAAIAVHVSPDGTQLLVKRYLSRDDPLWVVPLPAGAPRRLGEVAAHDGAWSTDGRWIVLAHGDELHVARSDGSDPRRLTSLPGRAIWPRWSPDGRRVRFTLLDARTHARSLWEIPAHGGEPRALFVPRADSRDECCGEWTTDGRHFVFRVSREGRPDIWVSNGSHSVLRPRDAEPRQLTTGPLHFRAVVPGRDGRRLFVVGTQPRSEMLRYDLEKRRFEPYDALPSGGLPTFSRDAEWVAYVDFRGRTQALWRSRVDGSRQLQLTEAPLEAQVARWSPDGHRIAFMGKAPGQSWKIYLVGADGGTPQILLEGDRNEADPSWSPDGRSLMFGRPPDYYAEPGAPKAIHLVDLRTSKVSMLPESEGLFSPRWSPDGRYVAAMPLDQSRIVLFDFATRKWTDLAPRTADVGEGRRVGGMHNPFWSRDGSLLYFQAGPVIHRARMSDRGIERIAGVADIERPVLGMNFNGLSRDGSPVVYCDLAGSDVYALDWDAH